jgi:thiol:disulfide interchange protein DsbC
MQKKLIAVAVAGLLSGAAAFAQDKQDKIEWNSLPLSDAFVFGDGARKIAIFSDPTCVSCRALERDLDRVPGIAVYYLPVTTDAESSEKNRAIACSPDPREAWRAWMVGGVQPPPAPENCIAEAAARNKNFAKLHGINVVPTAIFEDGGRVVGAAAIKSALAVSK